MRGVGLLLGRQVCDRFVWMVEVEPVTQVRDGLMSNQEGWPHFVITG